MDLNDLGVLSALVSQVETLQNQERKRKEWDNWQIMSGNLLHYVRERLSDIYPNTYSSFTMTQMNVTRKIVDKLSVSYSKRPKRILESENETASYNKLLFESNGDAAFAMFDRYANLSNYAAIQFLFTDKKTHLRALTPFQFDRIVDDFGETKVVIMSLPTENGKTQIEGDNTLTDIQDSADDHDLKRYSFWSEEQFVKVTVKGKGEDRKIFMEHDESNPSNRNPLGIIPFAFYQKGEKQITPPASPIGEQSIIANQMLSLIMTGAAVQTFGQLIIKHPKEQDMPDKLTNSMFNYIKLAQMGNGKEATEADYISPSPNLNAMLDVLSSYVTSLFDEYGIKSSQGVSGRVEKFTSALDRFLSFADTEERVELNQQSYQKLEMRVLDIFKAYGRVFNKNSVSSETISVVYNKQKPLLTESELLSNIKMKLDLGLITREQAIMKLDPNMDENKAKAQLELVKRDRAARMVLLGSQNQSSNKQEG